MLVLFELSDLGLMFGVLLGEREGPILLVLLRLRDDLISLCFEGAYLLLQLLVELGVVLLLVRYHGKLLLFVGQLSAHLVDIDLCLSELGRPRG